MISITIDIIPNFFCYNLIVLNAYTNHLALYVVSIMKVYFYTSKYLKEMYYTSRWNHG